MVNIFSSVVAVLGLYCLEVISGQAKEIKVERGELEIPDVVRSDGYEEIIRLNQLLDSGGNISSPDEQRLKPIKIAVSYSSDPRLIQLLVAAGAELKAEGVREKTGFRDFIPETPLYYALSYNASYKLIRMLRELELPEHVYPAYALLACAAQNPEAEVVHNLYSEMLNVLLLRAAKSPNIEIMERFRSLGANINAEYGGGTTSPLCAAIAVNNYDGVRYLVDSGAYLAGRYDRGRTVLQLAAANVPDRSTSLIVFYLLASGCDVNAIDWDGNTALHLAVRLATSEYRQEYGFYPLSVIGELLASKANVDIRNEAGLTPLEYVLRHRQSAAGGRNLASEVIQLLRRGESEQQKRLSQMQHGAQAG